MILWEKYVYDRLWKLTSADPKVNIKHAQDVLCAAWNARDVEFFDETGEPIHGRTLLSNALREPLAIRVGLELRCDPRDLADKGETALEGAISAKAPGSEPSPPPPAANARLPEPNLDPLFARLIVALDAQERRRDFVWAGYVVNDMLPRFGADKSRAQAIFDDLVDSGVLTLVKRSNPNNPDSPFKTTCVQLNHGHEMVKAALKSNGATSKSFEPVPIRGEPLSATIIRERR